MQDFTGDGEGISGGLSRDRFASVGIDKLVFFVGGGVLGKVGGGKGGSEIGKCQKDDKYKEPVEIKWEQGGLFVRMSST